MTQKKAPEPVEWLTFQGVVAPGEVGATKRYPGVFNIIDKGACEYGFQQPWSHEYFFKGKALKYKALFRQLRAELLSAAQKRFLMMSDQLFEEDISESIASIDEQLLEAIPAEVFEDSWVVEVNPEVCPFLEQRVLPPSEEKTIGARWFAIKPIDQTPYIISDEAVKKKRLPPLGKSALPKKIRNAIPIPLRYWNAKNAKEALLIRDELVELMKKDEIKLPIEELKESPAKPRFVLQYHWFAKVGMKKRAGASRWHFDLFLLYDGKKDHFELDHDPIETEETSAHISSLEFDHDEKAEGFIRPGEIGNPTKETGSWIEPMDNGPMILFEKKPTFVKVRFEGKKLKGVWTLEREAPGAEFWKVKKSAPAPGG